ncbi:hypothetical protein [Streptacidiphilus rugosus]|uniref:hypothetical protein n=1 Tax=Streptacidiphilus rugosus TaxID=405783 RepID=UPI0005625167|nr:hypothetical protein [Streptacidiphilus rugosus]
MDVAYWLAVLNAAFRGVVLTGAITFFYAARYFLWPEPRMLCGAVTLLLLAPRALVWFARQRQEARGDNTSDR